MLRWRVREHVEAGLDARDRLCAQRWTTQSTTSAEATISPSTTNNQRRRANGASSPPNTRDTAETAERPRAAATAMNTGHGRASCTRVRTPLRAWSTSKRLDH